MYLLGWTHVWYIHWVLGYGPSAYVGFAASALKPYEHDWFDILIQNPVCFD